MHSDISALDVDIDASVGISFDQKFSIQILRISVYEFPNVTQWNEKISSRELKLEMWNITVTTQIHKHTHASKTRGR